MTKLAPLALLPFLAFAALASEPAENTKFAPAQMAAIQAQMAD
jgi:hypothetical protein